MTSHTDSPKQIAATNGVAPISSEGRDLLTTAVTVGAVGVGVAMLEVALIPGMLIGVAAVAAPSLLPKIGAGLAPLFRHAVRGAYVVSRKTREAVAEAREHVEDIVAEVHSEAATSPAPKRARAASHKAAAE